MARSTRTRIRDPGVPYHCAGTNHYHLSPRRETPTSHSFSSYPLTSPFWHPHLAHQTVSRLPGSKIQNAHTYLTQGVAGRIHGSTNLSCDVITTSKQMSKRCSNHPTLWCNSGSREASLPMFRNKTSLFCRRKIKKSYYLEHCFWCER